jgi:Glycosyltransferase family 87
MSSALARPPRLGLIVLGAVAVALPLLTLGRIPTPSPDTQLYASIALARARDGVGIPTLVWSSPEAVDHIPFYGPVFFDLASAAYKAFGVSLVAFRLVSVFGAALYVIATAALARRLTNSWDRTLAAVVIVLMTGEVNFAATTGAMHMLAIGFEVAAMAAFARGRRLVTGVCLLLAALTTPRAYPFIVAFACAAAIVGCVGTTRRAVRRGAATALLVCAAGMVVWAVRSHGSVAAWTRYMTFIATHENTDVAVLPSAVRDFAFHWSGLLTPIVAIGVGVFAALSLRRRTPDDRSPAPALDPATGPALLLTWAGLHLVIGAVIFNYTFSINEYLTLPLLSVGVSWPWEITRSQRVIAAAMAGVLFVECGYLAYRYACLAVTWTAHDPAPIEAFVARTVPPGSVVVGPPSPFLFPVERRGSSYRTVSPRSWADWTRWVPIVEPGATALARTVAQPAPRERFFIWRSDDVVPGSYRCAVDAVVARYEAPPADERWPAWIVRGSLVYEGYPSATVYRLPPGCPSGYDPTRPPG